MAQKSDQNQDSWTDGMAQWRQAVEHNVTASRLLATGAIAIGAAATAYFWDPNRRTAFADSTRRLTEDMNNWWSGLGSGAGAGGGQGSSGTNAS